MRQPAIVSCISCRNTTIESGSDYGGHSFELGCGPQTGFCGAQITTLGTEFVGTSITSGGDGADSQKAVEAYLPENPHVHFYNNQRGYVRCV